MAIPREFKPRRSARPQDLRDAGPASDVERYWQPDAFQWHGIGSTRGKSGELYIGMTKYRIRISAAASKAADLKPGDLIEIGVNKTFLAVRKSNVGMRLRSERSLLYVSAKRLIDMLASEGWPVPCKMVCHWDERSRMLVAEKPPGGAS